MDIKEIAKKAISCQDASNLSGLVHSWSSWLPTIRAHAEAIGIAPNEHPVNVLMADKIRSLAGCDFSKAWDEATKIAEAA